MPMKVAPQTKISIFIYISVFAVVILLFIFPQTRTVTHCRIVDYRKRHCESWIANLLPFYTPHLPLDFRIISCEIKANIKKKKSSGDRWCNVLLHLLRSPKIFIEMFTHNIERNNLEQSFFMLSSITLCLQRLRKLWLTLLCLPLRVYRMWKKWTLINQLFHFLCWCIWKGKFL